MESKFNWLFVCTMNKLRSPTAEHVARLRGANADSAGTSLYAIRPLTPSSLFRSHTVVCMEHSHAKEVRAKLDEYGIQREVIVLDIPDIYAYYDPKLCDILHREFDKMKVGYG